MISLLVLTGIIIIAYTHVKYKYRLVLKIMNLNSAKASRGRPKTLNRDHILDVAMQAYWKEGINGVPLNEICRKAKVSKPGLYREFGNEDGLMKAVLVEYREKVILPIYQMLATDTPFRETLDKLALFMTTANDDQEVPKGCLLVKMRDAHARLGEATREQIDHTQEEVLTNFEDWVERSKSKGEFATDMSSQFAAAYIDSQLSNALTQIARGEQNNNVKKILTMAFSMLG
ncbi:MAG: TetR/AcrR family transcriptional regulator [Candidatus Porifericomitaceae bacterium WSBS_2022_MAG_OTU9]